MVCPLDESQGSSQLQGHGSWLMCEVALSHKEKEEDLQFSYTKMKHVGAWNPQRNPQQLSGHTWTIFNLIWSHMYPLKALRFSSTRILFWEDFELFVGRLLLLL